MRSPVPGFDLKQIRLQTFTGHQTAFAFHPVVGDPGKRLAGLPQFTLGGATGTTGHGKRCAVGGAIETQQLAAVPLIKAEVGELLPEVGIRDRSFLALLFVVGEFLKGNLTTRLAGFGLLIEGGELPQGLVALMGPFITAAYVAGLLRQP